MGGSLCRQTPRTYLLLGQCGLLRVSPRLAYHLSYEVEIHAATTYAKFLADNGPDEKILEILNDELEHSRELQKAWRKTMFKNWGKGVEPPEFTTKEEVQEMIDDAIRKHNRNASIISMCVGWVVLALLLRVSFDSLE